MRHFIKLGFKAVSLRTWLKHQSRRPWSIWVLRACIAGYMWLLYASCRKTFDIHPEAQALFDRKAPLLIGNWHGRLFLFAPFWRHKGPVPLSVISSPHADGLIVGGAAEVLGLKPLRGTRGGQGGAKAMREGLRALKQGHCLMLNPDGPAGPRHVLGPGTAALAQLSGAPFIAITYSCARARIATKNWDMPLYPHWFTRLTVQVSKPIYVDKSADREQVRKQLEDFMNTQFWALDAQFGHPKIEQK